MAEGPKISERHGVRIATIVMRRGARRDTVGDALGMTLTATSQCVAARGLAMIGSAPDTWLAIDAGGTGDVGDAGNWAARIADRLAGSAHVIDQTGGYSLFDVAGPAAKRLVQRGVFIDLDTACFGPGAAAATVIAHIPVLLWRVPGDEPMFSIAVGSSYVGSFRHWIATASATLDAD